MRVLSVVGFLVMSTRARRNLVSVLVFRNCMLL